MNAWNRNLKGRGSKGITLKACPTTRRRLMIYMTGWTSTNIAPAISAGPEAEALIEAKNLSHSAFGPKVSPVL